MHTSQEWDRKVPAVTNRPVSCHRPRRHLEAGVGEKWPNSDLTMAVMLPWRLQPVIALQNDKVQSFELRRLHSDLILVYKMVFKHVDLDVSDFFVLSSDDHYKRGHEYKLVWRQCRVNMCQHFFAERIVNVWNALNAQANDLETLKSFKMCLFKNDFSEFLTQKWTLKMRSFCDSFDKLSF